MKKNIKIALATVITTLAVNTCMTKDEFKVKLNGEYMKFDVPPVMIEDRILVPMRAIFEALGAEVSWDDATQTATGVTDDAKVSVTINEKAIEKNGEKTELDVPAQLVSERTMVPIRAVSEAFSCTVDWDDAESTVIIFAKNEEKENTETLEEKEVVELEKANSVLSDFEIIKIDDKYKINKKDGSVFLPGNFADISEMNGLIITTDSRGTQSVYTVEGNQVGRGDEIKLFGNGLLSLVDDEGVKYINDLGEVYTKAKKYDDTTVVCVKKTYDVVYAEQGNAPHSQLKEDKIIYAILDSKGRMITKPEYLDLDYTEGFYKAQNLLEMRGLLDKNGNTVIPFKYNKFDIYENIIIASTISPKKESYVYTRDGKLLSDESFTFVNKFIDGRALVCKKIDRETNRYGYINESGELIIPAVYAEAKDFEGGKAKVKLDGKYVNIDTDGNVVE